MKNNKPVFIAFGLLVLIAAIYRILPGRPLGFAPQLAMALFAGSIVKDKKYAFLLPLFSMLLSDILYQVLFQLYLSATPGFYSGQLTNYVLFVGLTAIGFWIKQTNAIQIFGGAVAGASVYFLLSNFAVWIGNGLDINSQPYSKTVAGLLHCYAEAIPFYRGSLYATLIFSTLLFGGYYLIKKYFLPKQLAVAA